ncbi:MAG: hypothetical protein C5B49_15480 [Bdellovibrio sp.]|nr:MAG: hypothetical protein C5B49_15480 [Bdellovibrio sp.]
MMKFILTIFILMPGLAYAESVTKDLFLKHFKVEVQSFVTNSDGSKILDVYGGQETTGFAYQPDKNVKGSSTWKSDFQGLPPVFITYDILIEDDLSVHVDVAEYEKLNPPSGLIRKASLPIRNFGTVSWVSKASSDKNIVVRFVPVLPTRLEPETLKHPVMALTDAIAVDNADRIWSRGVGGSGEVVALGTPYGRLVISFLPFAGSKELGTCLGQEVELKLTDKKMLWVRSRESIIGGGVRAKVFGLLQEDKRQKGHSIATMSVEDMAKILHSSAQ